MNSGNIFRCFLHELAMQFSPPPLQYARVGGSFKFRVEFKIQKPSNFLRVGCTLLWIAPGSVKNEINL